jgi:hypothetical protein
MSLRSQVNGTSPGSSSAAATEPALAASDRQANSAATRGAAVKATLLDMVGVLLFGDDQ